MRGPKPPSVTPRSAERAGLERVARRHGTPQQLALRARIILAAAAGANNAQIARALGVEADTARLWRTRWLGLRVGPLDELGVAERLEDAPRPGGPCRLTALACAAPAASGRPISRWSGRERAAGAGARGIVDRLSPRHASRLRKRGRAGPIASATG